ncbi:phosphopantetheine attachment site domain-containing protein [Pochonia chlamydosporia 170]|uniref:Acyl carrier protein n=1 Tax=Pochonia chlamydosporia 170 TaxID=1380566 RepID=A0A179FKN5_METCM|nr:phosphopantetheine attachment site domain-containing protein [Pochonia chlamydosporia 170]OAQ65780.1 phosphopantetheine attachment site domain-containing protein [Pochonia chlamydosporia 170]
MQLTSIIAVAVVAAQGLVQGATICERVKNIVGEQLGVAMERVTDNAAFVEDLGADALDVVELIVAFEEAFNTKIPVEAARGINTVQSACNYIKLHQATQNSPIGC